MSAPTQHENQKQLENIYLTAKTRMISEIRLKRNGKLLNLTITWYSFFFIILSLADLAKILNFQNFNVFSIASSVGVLIASLILQGERYQERAERFRECYLKLQGLYREAEINRENVLAQYQNILDNYENHSEFDYQSTLVSAWWNKKNLENSSGPISADKKLVVYVIVRKIFSALLWLIVFFLPVVLAFFIK